MKIRTITAGLALDPTCAALPQTLERLAEAEAAFRAAGYEVQTTRVAFQPVDTLVQGDVVALEDLADRVHEVCVTSGFEFVSLGPVNSQRRLDLVEALPALLAEHEMLNASVQLTFDGRIDEAATHAAAEVIRRLAHETPDGIGNFRFAATASCPPGIPFFPSAYHDGGSPTLAVGLESADLVERAFGEAGEWRTAGEPLVAVFSQALRPVADQAAELAARWGWRWLGIDLSPAPLGQVSIARAFERLGLGLFGGAGTLSIAALTTQALQQVPVQKCGFSGLMFPVLEDAVLGQRNAEGRLDLQDLLLYSTVCGTGLDTVPLPGDTPVGSISRLLLDVASLSVRFNKPLSARLFPVPGREAGEMTTFDSPYLTNTVIMRLD